MKEQWIMVMNRDKRIICDWGMEVAFSATELGFSEALQKALDFKKENENKWSNMEYKIDGGEW